MSDTERLAKLARAVAEMRTAQNEYFRLPDGAKKRSQLLASKAAEARVDVLIAFLLPRLPPEAAPPQTLALELGAEEAARAGERNAQLR